METQTDISPFYPGRRSIRNDVLWVLATAAIYHVTARLSLLLVIEPEGIAAIWPPEGLFLSSLMLTRPRLRPWLIGALYVSDLAAEVGAGTPLPVSMVYSLALAGSAGSSAWILLRLFGGPIYFKRGREAIAFIAFAVLLVNFVMSLLAAWASVTLPGAEFWTSWERWAASDGVGNLLVTPLIMSMVRLFRSGMPAWKLNRVAEATLLFIALGLTGYVAFHRVADYGGFSLLLTYMAFPFMLWAAWRFGVPGSAAACALLAAIAIQASVEWPPLHVGGVSRLDAVITVQFYVAVLVLPTLLLASLTSEMREAYGALKTEMSLRREAEERLQQNARRVEALLALNQMVDAPLSEITDFALEAAIRITGSKIGYIAFVNEDESVLTMHSWSRQALSECLIRHKPLRYIVADTGLWGEAIRQRKAVITNDYDAPSPLKRGYPEGHVRVMRHMNAPIFDGPHIVIVAGVGNKDQPYMQWDVEQLTLLMEGMWHLVTRKNSVEAIRQANENLRRSNQDLEQYAYAASHDLQEPLRMVTAYMDLLSSRNRDRLDEDSREYIEFAVEGAHRMKQLIGDLLAYSRVTTRGKQLQRVSSQSAMDRAVANLRSMIEETAAEITHDPLPEVLGDETQLTQLLMNLLSNAMKFHSDRSPRVHVGARRQGQEWIFSVRDNGIGIEPEYFQRIFQPFQRLHARDVYPGSGIGLAICKRIVERHGGRIWLESVVGHETTFFFTIKAVASDDAIEETE